jgi:membrane protease YdiL (CAAX protease family)
MTIALCGLILHPACGLQIYYFPKRGSMQTILKTRPVLVQLIMFIGLAFGMAMIFSTFGIMIYASVNNIQVSQLMNERDNTNFPGFVAFIRFSQALQFFGLFLLPTLIFAYFSDRQPRKYLGLRAPWEPSYWVYAILIMIVALPLVQYTGILNRQISFSPEMQQWIQEKEDMANKIIAKMLNTGSPKDLLLNILFIAVTAAIGEELFFRGVLQRMFIRWFGSPWAGILLAALIFSAFHMQFLGFLPRLLLGIILGAVYWYSGSLWVAIAAHFVYDAFLITLVYFQPRLAQDANADMIDPAHLSVAGFVSAILVGILLWKMIRNSRTTYAEIYRDDKPKDEFSF